MLCHTVLGRAGTSHVRFSGSPPVPGAAGIGLRERNVTLCLYDPVLLEIIREASCWCFIALYHYFSVARASELLCKAPCAVRPTQEWPSVSASENRGTQSNCNLKPF